MRVVTRNSIYSVKLDGNLFRVKRIASTWGQRVIDDHAHYTAHIALGVGESLITGAMQTSPIIAILPE